MNFPAIPFVELWPKEAEQLAAEALKDGPPPINFELAREFALAKSH